MSELTPPNNVARPTQSKRGCSPKINNIDSLNHGQLAGFTNPKQEYEKNDRQPYVLLNENSAKVSATKAIGHIEQIEDKDELRKEVIARLEAIKAVKPGYAYSHDPVREYMRQAHRLMTKYGDKTDLSRMDWIIVTDMAKSGNFTLDSIVKVLEECSPNIESRKTGHIEDYSRRMVDKAWSAPEVVQHRRMLLNKK